MNRHIRALIADVEREGLRERLIGADRIPESLADRWMVAWEADHVEPLWGAAHDWIARHVAAAQIPSHGRATRR
jgi:hypothetical protein